MKKTNIIIEQIEHNKWKRPDIKMEILVYKIPSKASVGVLTIDVLLAQIDSKGNLYIDLKEEENTLRQL